MSSKRLRVEKAALESLFQYLDNPALLPVWVVLVSHFALLIAPLALAVHRGGSVLAVVGLVGFVLGTAYLVGVEVRHRGRPGLLTGSLIGTWGISVGLTWLGITTNFI